MEIITRKDIEELQRAANIAGFAFRTDQIVIQHCIAGKYTPDKLPEGKMAVYMFFYRGKSLKVGKVNKGSNQRYQYQHYKPNSNGSVLAKNLINTESYLKNTNINNVREWMLENLDRYNILIAISLERYFLHFAEAFFILKYRPEFEKGT